MPGLKGLSSDQLLAQLLALVHRGRKLEVDLIEHLAEVDARRLYLREGYPSMFAYCVEVLRFAEAVAYKRIAAMRAARRYPELLTTLQKGDLHLTAVSLLAPHLTAKNVTELLAAARHRTADEIRRMLADRRPKPDVVSSVRRLSDSSVRGVSTSRSGSSVCVAGRIDQSTAKVGIQETALDNESGLPATPPAQPARPSGAAVPLSRPPEPLGDERYLIRFTADRELHAQIRELKSLMRHQIPDGDVGRILAKAVAVLLKQARARKFGACSAPRAARSERIVRTESAERVGPTEQAASAKRIGPTEQAASAKRVGRTEQVASAKRIGPAQRAEQAAEFSPSRQIPAAIRRAVSKRDGECCTFESAAGRRCGSRDFLEFHHREPWARHRSHAIDGITLRCRAHNQYEAELDFGAKHMQRFRRRDQPQADALLLNSGPLAALQPELDLNPVRGTS
jgi:hypothetical protein